MQFSVRAIPAVAGAILIGLLQASPVSATLLFFDDFEDDLAQWAPVGNGQIVNDPAGGTNHVLSFTDVTIAGDIFTSGLINLTAGQTYRISFDFYGDSLNDSASGGYAGISSGTPGNHGWYAGTAPDYKTLPNSFLLADDAGWQSYAYMFTAPITLQGPAYSAIRLMFEDFDYSGPIAGNAFFDNVALSAVPLPAALPLYGAGIAGLGLFGWIRRRRSSAA